MILLPAAGRALAAPRRRPYTRALSVAIAVLIAGCGGPGALVSGAATQTGATASPGTAIPTASATPSSAATSSATPAETPTGTPAATEVPATATPAVTAVPITTPPPAPFVVEVQPTLVARGDTLLVRVAGASGGVVRTAAGTSVPLLSSAQGAWAVVGIGLYADYGPATLSVSARDAQGQPIEGVGTATYTVIDPQRPADYLQVTEETASILTPEAAATESAMRAEQFSSFDSTPRWEGTFRYPVDVFQVSTQFGSGRSINGGPVGDFHTGEDLAADEGTPVVAAAAGRVAWVGTMPIRGNAVIVDHGAGVLTGYHHLLDYTVRVGQDLAGGELLGHVGSTGFSTGPHLHWELTVYGINVDPATWTTHIFPR